MLLNLPDVELFFRLHRTLLFFVNQRLGVVSGHLATPEEITVLPPEDRLKLRDALSANVGLIETFVTENPAQLPEDELAIIHSWRHLVAGTFYIFRELAKYTVFLSSEKLPVAYGVLGLSQPFEDMVGPCLPAMTKTVLLPFKDKIIYDGLLSTFSISFGGGIRRMLNESFKSAKLRHGIVTALPMSDIAPARPAKPPRARPRPQAPSNDLAAAVLRNIIQSIDGFCEMYLNEEYAVLCRKLAQKLARKRPSPLMGGHTNGWACGIIRTIGWANFLHDKTQTPHMQPQDIDACFGVSSSSGAAKQAAIRKMCRIRQLDREWMLPSSAADERLDWIFTRLRHGL